ncbi:MAG: TIGR01906 family membrane protein [Dehalococcoidia bacterium]
MRKQLTLLQRLATALFVLSVPVVLITSNVRFAANEVRLYQYGFDRYNAEARTGIPRPELDRAARGLITYFSSDQRTVDIRVEEDGRQVPLFNQRETLHLADVKNLLRLVFRTQEIALALALTYVVAAFVLRRQAGLRRLATEVAAGAGLALAIVVGLGGFALIGFDDLFQRFHLLAFTNDFWQLNPRTDHLIQMFPQGFWFDATMFIGLLTLAEAAALGLPAFLFLRRYRQRAERPLPLQSTLQAPK